MATIANTASEGVAAPATARRWWHPPILLAPGEGVFADHIRQLGVAFLCATLPVIAVLGALVRGEHAYLTAWALVTILYAGPALIVTWIAGGRAPAADQRFWRLWWLGLALVFVNSVAVVAVQILDLEALRRVGAVAVVAAMVAFAIPLVTMMRSRSGARALSLDLTEGALVLVGTTSLAPLVFGQQILDAPAAWFTIPAAIATVGLICSFSWALVLFVRLDGAHRIVEALGVALALLGAISAGAQVAQAISGFTMLAPPLLALQGLVMGLALLTPLHLPRNVPAGLDRFPPQQQVRKGGALAALPLVVVPVLAAEALVVGDAVSWSSTYVAAVVVTMLVLSTARHVLATGETRRLYAEVERSSEERRLLIADVIAAADQDRHRIAAQLHEQAMSTYVALTTYARTAGASGDEREARALRAVGEDLERRAEALRQLMVAVRPLEVADQQPSSLAASIGAYVHSLYGDRRSPDVVLRLEHGLELDWTTETIAVRIIQEALRNVWRHAGATRLEVTIGYVDDAIEVSIADDGIGFDPTSSMFESGIASMRSFAAFADGAVAVTSAPGAGTTVRARLGGGEPLQAVAHGHDGTVIDLRDRVDGRRRAAATSR